LIDNRARLLFSTFIRKILPLAAIALFSLDGYSVRF